MEQFEERLARLTELSGDELTALEAEMVAAFEAADTAGDVETMQAIADALDTVRDARSNAEASAPAEQPVAASGAPGEDGEVDTTEDAPSNDGEDPEVPSPEDETTEPEATSEEAVEETPQPEAAETPEVPEEEVTTEPEPVPVEASVATAEVEAPAEEAVTAEAEAETTETPATEAVAEEPVVEEAAPASETNEIAAEETEAAPTPEESEESVDTNLTAADVPEENAPAPASPPVTIRAGGDIPGVTAGAALADMDEVVEALTLKVNSLRNVRGDGQRVVVASMRVEEEVPEHRLLRAGDSAGNSRKIRELLSDQDALQPEALTAAAWCAPRAPIYDVPTIGSTVRPVANSLPTFSADRGGITWMQPPGIGVSGGVGLWRHDGSAWDSWTTPDASGSSGTTKPCATVTCGTEQNMDVDAITLCLCFDNMTARAFPEWIRANTDLVLVQQARFAEQVLLSRMFSVSTTGSTGTPGTQVGAARDFFITVRIAAANFRWERRLGREAPLQLLAPSWVAEAMAADLDLQSPGDDTLGTSLGEVTALFNEINVSPIWFIDDVPGTANTSGQFTAANTFPTYAHWLLYPTGSFIRLDTGELNLGVVRDMDHVQANTYCEFSETFETVAYMGPGSPNGWVQRGLTPIDLAGSSGAPRTITIS